MELSVWPLRRHLAQRPLCKAPWNPHLQKPVEVMSLITTGLGFLLGLQAIQKQALW